MDHPPIEIADADVVADIMTLADRTGVPPSLAVAHAVRLRLAQLPPPREEMSQEERMRRVREILARLDALPTVGPRLTDDDLYDEDGLRSDRRVADTAVPGWDDLRGILKGAPTDDQRDRNDRY